MRRLILVVALAFAGCVSIPGSSGAVLPAELRRVLDDYTKAWETRDAPALAALFAADRTVVPNACPPARNRTEVETCYANAGGRLSLRALDHRIDGSIAYIIGEYAVSADGPAAGKFVLTLVKDATGRWLIAADMDREYRRQPAQP
jgi:ketosteroid isomerase-like protein